MCVYMYCKIISRFLIRFYRLAITCSLTSLHIKSNILNQSVSVCSMHDRSGRMLDSKRVAPYGRVTVNGATE